MQVSAVCDIWRLKILSARRVLDPERKGNVQVFENCDEMLEKAGKDFDAVIIATPAGCMRRRHARRWRRASMSIAKR